MNKIYLLLLAVTISTGCFTQNHKTLIAEYRKKYMDDFLADAHSPLKKEDLPFLRFYDADSTYSVKATVKILANQSPFDMQVITGSQGSSYERYALISFTLKGKPLQLTLYKSVALSQNPMYTDYLFLPVPDDTNGTTTYGGGRYIDLRTGDIKDGSITIDFNKAYNPYCAFSGGYARPKPPGENKLDFAVEAGEQNYEGTKNIDE